MIQFDNAIKRFSKLILTELKEEGITCWLAGGAIRDYFAAVPVKTDYDIFFPNEEEYQKAKMFFKEKSVEVKWESDNGMKVVYNNHTYDLVKKFFPNPQAAIEEFDFTVSMFAVDTEKVYYGETSFIDLAKKQLMINKLPMPASSLSRAFRYHKKGYSICSGETKKLFEAIQNFPKIDSNTEKSKSIETITNPDDISSGELGAFFRGFD